MSEFDVGLFYYKNVRNKKEKFIKINLSTYVQTGLKIKTAPLYFYSAIFYIYKHKG